MEGESVFFIQEEEELMKMTFSDFDFRDLTAYAQCFNREEELFEDYTLHNGFYVPVNKLVKVRTTKRRGNDMGFDFLADEEIEIWRERIYIKK